MREWENRYWGTISNLCHDGDFEGQERQSPAYTHQRFSRFLTKYFRWPKWYLHTHHCDLSKESCQSFTSHWKTQLTYWVEENQLWNFFLTKFFSETLLKNNLQWAFCLKALKFSKCCFQCAFFGILSANTSWRFPLCKKLEGHHCDIRSCKEGNKVPDLLLFPSHTNYS